MIDMTDKNTMNSVEFFENLVKIYESLYRKPKSAHIWRNIDIFTFPVNTLSHEQEEKIIEQIFFEEGTFSVLLRHKMNTFT